MTYVVTSNCVDCKFTDCVAVCPVSCFYEDDTKVVIDPEECIDCEACVDQCPVEAIYADEDVPENEKQYITINAEVSKRLKDEGQEPITEDKDPLPTAETRKAELGF